MERRVLSQIPPGLPPAEDRGTPGGTSSSSGPPPPVAPASALLLATGLLAAAGPADATSWQSKAVSANASCGLGCVVTVNVKVGATCGVSNAKVYCLIDYDVWGFTRAPVPLGPAAYSGKVEAWNNGVFLIDKTARCENVEPLWGYATCSGSGSLQSWNVPIASGSHCWSFCGVASGTWTAGVGTVLAPPIYLCVNTLGQHAFG